MLQMCFVKLTHSLTKLMRTKPRPYFTNCTIRRSASPHFTGVRLRCSRGFYGLIAYRMLSVGLPGPVLRGEGGGSYKRTASHQTIILFLVFGSFFIRNKYVAISFPNALHSY